MVQADNTVLSSMVQSIVSSNVEDAIFEGLTLLAKLADNKVKKP